MIAKAATAALLGALGNALLESLDVATPCQAGLSSGPSRPINNLDRQETGRIGRPILDRLPTEVIHANCVAKMRELDAQLCGLFITRAAISNVTGDSFEDFMETHVEALKRLVQEHPVAVESRIGKAQAKYRFW